MICAQTWLGRNQSRVIRRRLAQEGYAKTQIDYGMTFARGRGFVTVTDGFNLAMSRILLSDARLNDGWRYPLRAHSNAVA